MFELVERTRTDDNFYFLRDDARRFLHSDGSILNTPEYWPTREAAQVVLDKFQPKHEWKHGDVFELTKHGFIMMYIHLNCKNPRVIHLNHAMVATLSACRYLEDAEFLFNVMEKL
jgi:hypothetical protein